MVTTADYENHVNLSDHAGCLDARTQMMVGAGGQAICLPIEVEHSKNKCFGNDFCIRNLEGERLIKNWI